VIVVRRRRRRRRCGTIVGYTPSRT